MSGKRSRAFVAEIKQKSPRTNSMKQSCNRAVSRRMWQEKVDAEMKEREFWGNSQSY